MNIKTSTYAFLFDLRQYEYLLQEKEKYSTLEERQRAEKYTSPGAERKILSYMIRRIVLSILLDCDPLDIKYKYNKNGKPFDEEDRIFFNVSQRDNWLGLLLDFQDEVGVDIEIVKNIPKFNAFLSSYLSPKEKKIVIKQEGYMREYTAHAFWSMKESYLKAIGVGLSYDMKKIEFHSQFIEEKKSVFYTWIKDRVELDNAFSMQVVFKEDDRVIYCFTKYNESYFEGRADSNESLIDFCNPQLTKKDVFNHINKMIIKEGQ
ncbi:4'-phosphopantetheinyl transferase superfamily protein [bacterium]|nr:4'-phosphopantetheinyl transferase superfamily protein [bacterium]